AIALHRRRAVLLRGARERRDPEAGDHDGVEKDPERAAHEAEATSELEEDRVPLARAPEPPALVVDGAERRVREFGRSHRDGLLAADDDAARGDGGEVVSAGGSRA